MTTGDHGVGPRPTPPGPEVPVAITPHVQPPPLRLGDEPLPQLPLHRIKPMPREPTTPRIPPDCVDSGKKLGSAGHGIGTVTPRSAAMARASS
jgi:hypothetical protein